MPTKPNHQPRRRGRGRPFVKGDPRAGRPKGCLDKVTLEGREFARGILGSAEYRTWLAERVANKALPPQLEVMLWHYGFGTPKQTLEHTGPDGGPISIAQIERVIVDERKPAD